MKKLALGIFAAALSTSATAGTFIDDRGYKECERSLSKEFGDAGLMFERQYMVKRGEEARTFFINGYVWNDMGERTQLNSKCVTTSNGRDVIELDSDMGSHILESDVIAAR